MNFTRRLILKASIATASLAVFDRLLHAKPTHNALPDPSRFQSGDLLWPKYHGTRTLSATTPEFEEKLLNDAINRIRDTIPQNASPKDISELNSLTLDRFRDRYYGGQASQQPLSAGTNFVGHVGIVFLEKNVPLVIEAVLHANPSGVRQVTYTQWLDEYQKAQPAGHPFQVWHARPSASLQVKGEDIALEAKKYLARPYSLANTSLDDTSSFYCSKLAYFCIRASARNDAAMKRLNVTLPVPTEWSFPWISPRSLLENGNLSGALTLINAPSTGMNDN